MLYSQDYSFYHDQDLYLPVVVQNSGNDAVIENVPQVCLLVLAINVAIPAVAVLEEYKFCCNLGPT